MLAASQTSTRHVVPDPSLMTHAELAATNSVRRPTRFPATIKPPCMPAQRMREGAITTIVFSDSDRSVAAQARCFYGHGFLTREELRSIVAAQPLQLRHGVARVVPLSLQVEPTNALLAIWSLLLLAEVVMVVAYRGRQA